MTRRSLRAPALLLAARCSSRPSSLAPLVVALASITGGPSGTALTPANYLRVLADQYHWDVILVTFRLAFYHHPDLRGAGLSAGLVSGAGGALAGMAPGLRDPAGGTAVHQQHRARLRLDGAAGPQRAGQPGADGDRRCRPSGALHRRGAGHPDRHGHVLLPFVVLAVGNALARVDPACEQASADLGASPRPPSCVTWPLTLPGVISGAIIVFTLAVSAYVTPALLSGGASRCCPC